MNMFRNDVFMDSGHPTRLLSAFADQAWVIRLDDPKALPQQKATNELNELEPISGKEVDPMNRFQSGRASHKAVERRNKAWERIKPLIDNSAIFDPATRGPLVTARAEVLGCSKQTLMKDLRRYWQGGQTMDALLGLFHRCGVSSDGKPVRRGRKPKHIDYQVYVLGNEDKAWIESILKNEYVKRDLHTYQSAYRRLLELRYAYQDGNGARYLLPLGERPTFKQFLYQAHKILGDEIILRRKGDKNFEQNHRARLGSIMEACHGVGHVYEIDASIADVYLVSSADRTKIVGKPTLFLIKDRFSRLIVGWYIGFESASWTSAMMAILSITEDKAALCQRYGIPYNSADWPAHGVFPQEFVGDRGEMLSKNSSQICDGLAITVTNAPSMRPDRKSVVECGFRLLHSTIRDSVPGYEPQENVQKRRGQKYDQDACLTLEEFKRVMLANIITHNRMVMTAYPLSPSMIDAGIEPSPLSIWRHEAPKRMGVLTRYPAEWARFKLLPTGKAVISREGIFFKDCWYSCQEAIDQGWFVSAGKGRASISVAYDPRLTDEIFLHDTTDRTKFITARLLPKSLQYQGLSFDEVSYFERQRDKIRARGTQSNYQVMADFHQQIDPTVGHALTDMRAQAKGRSRKSRKADIKQDRLVERHMQRQEEARMPAAETFIPKNAESTAPEVEAVPSTETASHTPLTLQQKLRLKRQEMLNAA